MNGIVQMGGEYNLAAEKDFENKIKAYLDEKGAWYIKYWAGSRFTRDGIPDILACVRGYFVAIEVKAQNGKYDPEGLQAHKIKEIRKAGGFAMVVFPSGWRDFRKFIDNLRSNRSEQRNT